ncbi:hypothetical protein A2961_03790 [Candidatus Woesebacteria bacterium RIFCSPLOWO2_01_FULL_39_21]|uniref:Ribbon-helix-helix protein CopG domain-containing protein n=1 Tax=Candidatus Woesebacteria bacterium RIFCSPLOWO2_01_FULL_39_21 TaxID=1802519 RepID=A0A1F8BCV1_9BACT|nr:MAG: hypothetical protein A2961_03790 [Candidatus Woesebacteria bacterium RIFCSPLOWO2_01_FULL_39_21]
MTVVNFTINDKLDEKMTKVIREKGFQSKAELFRFAVFNYLHSLERFKDEDEEFAYLESKLASLLVKKFGNKRLPFLKEQLKKI